MKINKSVSLQRWDSPAFPNPEIGKKVFLDLKKNLLIYPHPFSSWRPMPNQNLETISTNEKGFRSKSFKNLRFKKNAILLGGSVAWGMGATSNEHTPSYLIEKILFEKYGIEYNIINLAEQMFTSFEETKVFMATADELNPELVISLSGCNDVNTAYFNVFKSNVLYRNSAEFYLWGSSMGIIYEKNIFKKIIKVLLRIFNKQINIDDDFLIIKKPGQKQIASKLLENKIAWINTYCRSKKIPVVNILQPDLAFKKSKSKYEKEYIDSIDDDKLKFLTETFEEIKTKFFNKKLKEENELFLNFLNIFDNCEDTIFIDKTHFSNIGNKILAEKICLEISQNIKL